MARIGAGYQARGQERRKLLVTACRQLLEAQRVGTFGLAEVADRAGVPKTSVYHFFPSIDDLLSLVALEVAEELLSWLDTAYVGPWANWSELVHAFVARGRAFYVTEHAALELQLGPRTPAEIKSRDRTNDFSLGQMLRRVIADHFIIPDLPDLDEALFRAIEIADLMFMLSVRQHEQVTDFYCTEAARAVVAYLELYLPKLLPALPPDGT